MKSTMLRPVHEAAGLGSPHEQFSTNASESANALMKSKVDYKRSDLPVFIHKKKELASEQKKQLELTEINRGKFRFRKQYQGLQIPGDKWFHMSTSAQETHLKSFIAHFRARMV